MPDQEQLSTQPETPPEFEVNPNEITKPGSTAETVPHVVRFEDTRPDNPAQTEDDLHPDTNLLVQVSDLDAADAKYFSDRGLTNLKSNDIDSYERLLIKLNSDHAHKVVTDDEFRKRTASIAKRINWLRDKQKNDI